MKAILIAYDQAHHEAVVEALEKCGCRGFTAFGNVQGRGTHRGEPHYGTHAWPSLAQALISIVADESAPRVMQRLKELDQAKPRLGLRAFAWTVEQTI